MSGGEGHLTARLSWVGPEDAEPGVASLRAHGFRDVHATVDVAALIERIRHGYRDGESDLALAVIHERALQASSPGQRKRLLAVASEAGTGLVVVGARGQTPPAHSEAWVDVVDEHAPARETHQRVALAAAAQTERRRLQRVTRGLEAEVADLRVVESRLQHMVYHDELTGLWNRRRLREALELNVMRASSLSQPCAIVLVDVDRFKLVNDLEGYDVGDRLLIDVGRLVRDLAGTSDLAARIGSDEFVLLLGNCGADAAVERAEQVRRCLEDNRFRCGSRYYRTCASVGVATMAGGERRAPTTELLARADQACYLAKQHGRNRVHVYDGDDPRLMALRRDHVMAPVIRDAIENNRLFFEFQPIVRLLDGRISHYECLLRMRGHDGRRHQPGEFIPVAERTGLIHHIDLWVVDRALDFLATLDGGYSDASVSVNLSGHAFRNQDLVELIAHRLQMSRVSPARLVFEITETAAVANLEQGRDVVARLRALGCRFALDDFGSGFSTFHYIKHFPVDYLKIDGSFITNIADDTTDATLVHHMVSIARSLGKETVAEFVESRESLEAVAALGVDYVQGFYLARPAEVPIREESLPSLGPLGGEAAAVAMASQRESWV
ncbi:putative bifunctional diguanylate cyclase/phosphodiesterase [Arhodomonas sp. AD133]|uniref:putative bifunctional diguanylate cyclase/phosphodiesterase n=1 Tax=Arhodomonas sp. AD133 TaxID=3415009 RepID=UPI003EBED95D